MLKSSAALLLTLASSLGLSSCVEGYANLEVLHDCIVISKDAVPLKKDGAELVYTENCGTLVAETQEMVDSIEEGYVYDFSIKGSTAWLRASLPNIVHVEKSM